MTGRAVSREEAAGTACQGWGRAALCPPSLTAPLQGHPGTPILGQAMSMLTPHHCPLAALPGPRWRVAPSPHILICGPGWHLPWPPRDLVPAGQPPGGDPPSTKVARSAVYVYRSCWAGLRMCPGLASPLRPCDCVFSRPFLSRQGPASTRPTAAGGPIHLCLMSLTVIPLSMGPGYLGLPALPACPFLACLLPPGSWPLKGWRAQV